MKKIISIVLLLLTVHIMSGQSIIGTVLEQASKAPMPYVQVFVPEFKTGTVTDIEGRFELHNIAGNKVHLQLSYVGYKSIDTTVQLNTKELTFYMSEGHFKLEEVVVSVPGGKLQGDNITSVERRQMKELQVTNPLTLAEAITNMPGVEQRTTGAGIGKPVIRGLSGNRIITYTQGIRLENQQWGDEHGLGVGSVGIESVEVIKGPASLLYGADALGGVIYFVDERYTNQNTSEFFVQSKFSSNTLGTINNFGYKTSKNKLKFNLFGSLSSHADYQIPNGYRVFNTRFDEKNIKTSIGYGFKNWNTNVRYSFLRNRFGIVEDAVYDKSTDRTFKLPFQVIDNHNLSIENSLYLQKSKLNLILGYTNNNRKELEDSYKVSALGLFLNTYTYNFKWNIPVEQKHLHVIIGSQGMYQDNKNTGTEVLIPDVEKTDAGVFTVINYKKNRLHLEGGIRGDVRKVNSKGMFLEEISFSPFSNLYKGGTFSGGAKYKLGKTKIRLNVSSGFRAPSTSELLSNGVQPGTGRYVIGDTGVKNENATQFDFGINYENEHLKFSTNPFYNLIQNYIFLAPTGNSIAEHPVYKYKQETAFLYGGETGVHYHPHNYHWLHLESNLSVVVAQNSEGTPLPFIPQTKINTTIRTELKQKNDKRFKLKSFYVQSIYKFNQNRVGYFETKTVDYTLINIGVNGSLQLKKTRRFEWKTGVKNLLNQRYIDHLSRFKNMGIPNPGINFYVGIKLNITYVSKEK